MAVLEDYPVSERPTVLVVDDVASIRTLLAKALQKEGFDVQEAADGEDAEALFESLAPAVVLLDVNLPKLDGFQLLTRLKRVSDVPVILLSGRVEETDRILGLNLGADDYVVKPFSTGEVVARVRAVLRRGVVRQADAGPLDFGDLVIDLPGREARVGGRPVELTRREFDLLAFLASSPRQVFTRERLLDRVWGSRPEWQSPSTVTEHMRRLRLAVEATPHRPRHLVSVRGVGYRFVP